MSAKVAFSSTAVPNQPSSVRQFMADEFRHKKISISIPYWQIRMLEEERGTLSMSKFVSELVDKSLMERRNKRKEEK